MLFLVTLFVFRHFLVGAEGEGGPGSWHQQDISPVKAHAGESIAPLSTQILPMRDTVKVVRSRAASIEGLVEVISVEFMSRRAHKLSIWGGLCAPPCSTCILHFRDDMAMPYPQEIARTSLVYSLQFDGFETQEELKQGKQRSWEHSTSSLRI